MQKNFQFNPRKIQHRIEKKETAEDPICSETRLGLCLYKLGRGDYDYTIWEIVGVAECTVRCIVEEVCRDIIGEIWAGIIEKHFPLLEDNFKNALAEMISQWQYEFTFGAIDGSHIPIKCPPGGAEARNQYSTVSILLCFWL